MIATRERSKPVRRNILTSTRASALLVAGSSGAALATAFPKLGFAWIAPFALAGLFWSWFTTPARSAAAIGYAAGLVYFALMFSWFGETAASLVGPFGFVTVAGPAAIDATFFAIAGFLASYVSKRAPGVLAPLAAAAAFTVADWLRSVGFLGAPFAQVGYSQVATPFAALGAYGGAYFVTFTIAAIGAAIAWAILDRTQVKAAVVTILATVLVTGAAFAAWPARHYAPPSIPVAAIQGNIKQEIKWNNPASAELAVKRYITLTQSIGGTRPVLVVWPETVITYTLGDDDQLPAGDVAATQALRAIFAGLAQRIGTTLVVGSLESSADGIHNALYIFTPQGMLADIYRKRQLVPFAERLPNRDLFRWLPYADVMGKQARGYDPAVIGAGPLAFAPLICWESAFADVTHDQIARGANLLVIATDDAWFGTTAGPYQHAQIAQMRAIETGRWVVRAAATGISGIVAPDGRWTVSAPLGEQTAVTGLVGQPSPTLFAALGPLAVVMTFGLLYLIALFAGWRWPRPAA